jgi:hypothetical protein
MGSGSVDLCGDACQPPAQDAPICRYHCAATARRSGADDLCSRSGAFRVFRECARSADLRYHQTSPKRSSLTSSTRRRISSSRRTRSRGSVVWLCASRSGATSAAIHSSMRGVGSTNATTGSVWRPWLAGAADRRQICGRPSAVPPAPATKRPGPLASQPARNSLLVMRSTDGPEYGDLLHVHNGSVAVAFVLALVDRRPRPRLRGRGRLAAFPSAPRGPCRSLGPGIRA